MNIAGCQCFRKAYTLLEVSEWSVRLLCVGLLWSVGASSTLLAYSYNRLTMAHFTKGIACRSYVVRFSFIAVFH